MGTPVVDGYPTLFRESFFYILILHKFIDSLSGSEAMSLVQLFVPTEVAHDTVNELGELGNVEFKDVRFSLLSPTFSLSDSPPWLRSSIPT
jgi:hypothetical protein